MSEQLDTISYSAARKVPHPSEFGSYDFHVSMKTSICEGETEKDAAKRAVEFVETLLAFKLQKAQRGQLKY